MHGLHLGVDVADGWLGVVAGVKGARERELIFEEVILAGMRQLHVRGKAEEAELDDEGVDGVDFALERDVAEAGTKDVLAAFQDALLAAPCLVPVRVSGSGEKGMGAA